MLCKEYHSEYNQNQANKCKYVDVHMCVYTHTQTDLYICLFNISNVILFIKYQVVFTFSLGSHFL